MYLVIKKPRFFRILIMVIAAVTGITVFSVLHTSKTNSVSDNDAAYMIMIYIDEKKLYILKNGRCIREYPIASGKPESPSPIGEWKIIEKYDWGEGFGGCWMGLNVLWGTYGIHGTAEEGSIGYAASHGCIRMYNNDVKELYDMVPVGTSVIIKDGAYGPFGTGFRELTPGDRGADVLAIQKKLKELGYYHGPDDGIYEDDLKQAVYSFQLDNKLTVKYTITYEDYLMMGFQEIE